MKKIAKLLVLSLIINLLLLSMPALAQTTIFNGTIFRQHLNTNGPQTVFTGDQTGYVFYCDGFNLLFSKTTNGGTSWENQVQIDNAAINGDCEISPLWYDQWTPGDSGTKIHILAADSSLDDDLIYIEFDTSDDSYIVAGNISDAAGMAPGNYEAWVNNLSITKATDGDLYAAVADDTSHYVLTCTATCTTASNWAETNGNSPFEGADDHILLMPLAGGDILMVQHDLSDNVIESKVWDKTSWSDFTTIESSVEDLSGESQQTEFGSPPLVGTLNPTDNTIYIAYIDYDTGVDFGTGDDDDIKTAKYSGGTWSTTTNASTNNGDGVAPYGLSMAYDESNDDVYLVYSGPDNVINGTHSDTTTNYYYKSSTDKMSTWSSQSAALATSDHTDWRSRTVGMNLMSDERLYLVWYTDSGSGNEYLYGATIVDLIPSVPEFSTYLYIISITFCLFMLYNNKKKLACLL